jgi:hypothetical protein
VSGGGIAAAAESSGGGGSLDIVEQAATMRSSAATGNREAVRSRDGNLISLEGPSGCLRTARVLSSRPFGRPFGFSDPESSARCGISAAEPNVKVRLR